MPPVPMTSKRMTANPVRPQRYRPGKGVDQSSSDDESDDEEEDEQKAPPKAQARAIPKQVLYTRIDEKKSLERREQEKALRERERQEEFRERERMEREAGFVTESEESDAESGDDEEDAVAVPKGATAAPDREDEEEESSEEDDEDSSEEESSSEEERPRMIRPVFIKKDQRNQRNGGDPLSTFQTDEQAEELKARRRAQVDEMIQDEYDRRQAVRAATDADWDAEDTNLADADAVDDTDGLDPELERKLWEQRELQRLTRARRAMKAREDELAELERRRNLTTPERDAEDREHLAAQREERASRGKMAHLQKYHHGGAFFGDDADAERLRARDLMGARFVDQTDKTALPAYLQRRDETKIGKKGATRYKDMRSEDTGRFGELQHPHAHPRFRDGAYADRDDAEVRERTGANASALGTKRKGLSTSEAMREEAKKLRTE